jgi:hypothetical protein
MNYVFITRCILAAIGDYFFSAEDGGVLTDGKRLAIWSFAEDPVGRQKGQAPLKRRQLPARLHGVTTREIAIDTVALSSFCPLYNFTCH